MKIIHYCEICGFGYANSKTAKACEKFCKTHNSCSIKITKKAVAKRKPRI